MTHQPEIRRTRMATKRKNSKVSTFQPSNPRLPGARTTRRLFLGNAARTVAVGSLAALDISRFAYGASGGVIRLGLIGCGGRGTGGARQALATGKDVKLVAMADVLEEKITWSLNQLKRDRLAGGQVDVSTERQFSGFNGYEQLLSSGVDAVILATPPGFRPLHFEAAVKAGAHCFLEKPVAVDAPGVRQVRAGAKLADEKQLSAIVGMQQRFDPSYQEFISRISDGAIGKITGLQALVRSTNIPKGKTRADV